MKLPPNKGMQRTASFPRAIEYAAGAFIESFFHSMKSEIYHGHRYRSDDEIRAALKSYLPSYNSDRLLGAGLTESLMELATLRKMIVATIALLLIYQVGTWIAAFFGGFWGGLAALVVAAVSVVCVRLAGSGAKNIAWFLVPSLLFALVPLVAKGWKALADNQSTWVDHVLAITPFLVGFVVPVVLLLLVYAELRRRTLGGQPAAQPGRVESIAP